MTMTAQQAADAARDTRRVSDALNDITCAMATARERAAACAGLAVTEPIDEADTALRRAAEVAGLAAAEAQAALEARPGWDAARARWAEQQTEWQGRVNREAQLLAAAEEDHTRDRRRSLGIDGPDLFGSSRLPAEPAAHHYAAAERMLSESRPLRPIV